MTEFRRPRRVTGRAKPDPNDLEALARSERAQHGVEEIWIDNDRQRAILNEIRTYMRVSSDRRRTGHAPLTGRRLSQFSQAGKSAIAEQLVKEVASDAAAVGLPENPYRVVHVTIDPRMTLKMLYQEILNRLADDFSDTPGTHAIRPTCEEAKKIRGNGRDNVKVLEQRVEEWVVRLGVELIIVDEIQRLVARPEAVSSGSLDPRDLFTDDAMAVTRKLQAFLDRGIVPLFFIGDETSPVFFKLNNQFAARLLRPLELKPLDVSKPADRKRFYDFCVAYDAEITSRRITSVRTCLVEEDVLAGLIEASGGHIGRAARIIQVALPAAMARGAITLEAYDLSNAVRDFAMEVGWVDYDPFAVPRETTERVPERV